MSETAEAKITVSCGCAFCDLDLKPDTVADGRPAHSHRRRGKGYSLCTNPAIDAALATPAPERMR